MRVDEWNVNKWAWEGALKVISKREECIIRLEDKTTGELYARAFLREWEPHPVEPVIDSSSYFTPHKHYNFWIFGLLSTYAGRQLALFHRSYPSFHWQYIGFYGNQEIVVYGKVFFNQNQGFVSGNGATQPIYSELVFFGEASSLLEELKAMLRGLQICKDKRYFNLEVETNLAFLVQFLQFQATWPWRYHSILAQIRDLLSTIALSTKHIYHQSNSITDALAKHASSIKTAVWFSMDTLPARIRELIYLDMQGFLCIRSCSKVV